jgi:hypothetical protein
MAIDPAPNKVPPWRMKAVTSLDLHVPILGKDINAQSELTFDKDNEGRQQIILKAAPNAEPVQLEFKGITNRRPATDPPSRGIQFIVDIETRALSLFVPRTASTLSARRIESGALFQFYRQQVQSAPMTDTTVTGPRRMPVAPKAPNH